MKKSKNGTTFVAFRLEHWMAVALNMLASEDNRSRNGLMRAIARDHIKSRMNPDQICALKNRFTNHSAGDSDESSSSATNSVRLTEVQDLYF